MFKVSLLEASSYVYCKSYKLNIISFIRRFTVVVNLLIYLNFIAYSFKPLELEFFKLSKFSLIF